MAETLNTIFNKKATEKLRSPDDLEKTVRVTNPSVWVVLAACIVLLAGLLAWGIFGAVSTTMHTNGVNSNGRIICLVTPDDKAKISVGDYAEIGGHDMSVKSISRIPISRQEAHALLGNDYLVSALMQDDWAYLVEFEGDAQLEKDVPLPIAITVDRKAPISLILKN